MEISAKIDDKNFLIKLIKTVFTSFMNFIH